MASKFLCGDVIDIKVHYNYHGQERCGLLDVNYSELFGMCYIEFENVLKREIPFLNRLAVLRISFLDDETSYIDLTERNFHRFVKLAIKSFNKDDNPKINLKCVEGSSPLVVKTDIPPPVTGKSKRSLEYDTDEFSYTDYKSPIELEITLKGREVANKESELKEIKNKYENVWQKFNPIQPQFVDASKTVCTRCHLRLGHTKNKCTMNECMSAEVCGQVDRHPAEKKELSEFSKKKQKVEGELKALACELKMKEKVSTDRKQSFEAKVHDVLIRTNPSKYLTENRRPKEGLILQDSYILKQYYGNANRSKESLETDAEIFQTIIQSHNEKVRKPVKNSVQRQMEMNAVNSQCFQWPPYLPQYMYNMQSPSNPYMNMNYTGMQIPPIPMSPPLPQENNTPPPPPSDTENNTDM